MSNIGPCLKLQQPRPHRRRPELDRFIEKVLIADSGCWEWVGSRLPSGYGRFGDVNKRSAMVLAHRWSYEYFAGPIPAGAVIDHMCRNKLCVNPLHIDAVTPYENNARSIPFRRTHTDTHCVNGHAWNESNIYRKKGGGKNCRTCRNLSVVRWREGRKP